MSAEVTTTDGVVLSDKAASKVKALLEQEGRDDLRLRIAVQPGGCSGLRYQLFFDDRNLEGDTVVEFGTVEDIFYRPKHPYTRGLLDSIPHFETGNKLEKLKKRQEQEIYKNLEQDIVKKYFNLINKNLESIKSFNPKFYTYALQILFSSVRSGSSVDPLSVPLTQRYNKNLQENVVMNKINIVLKENQLISENISKEEIRQIIRDELEKLLKKTETKKDIAKITKEFVKKFYRELSFNSTHVIDQIEV